MYRFFKGIAAKKTVYDNEKPRKTENDDILNEKIKTI